MEFHLSDITNPKKLIEDLIQHYQTATYFFLCLIIFCETGLVATPFLPGDSLLFTAGMLAATNPAILNPYVIILLLICSAILGDNVNYFVGKKLGTRVFEIKGLRKIIKRQYLEKTEEYYAKHGGTTIIIARFIPIVRTFAPFAAGLGSMNYRKYILFCVGGAILWVSLLTMAGYLLGTHPFISKHYEKVIFGIILVSVLPVIIKVIKHQFFDKKETNS
jgi:membrane-associated protein